MKLNLGCGDCVPDGWINVDYSLGARFARIPLFNILNRKLKLFNLDWNDKIHIHDLNKEFPWKDDTVDVIYCSHLLEHFTQQRGRVFLIECNRVLRKDGIIRLVVPDLGYIIKDYIDGKVRADDLIGKLGVLYENSRNPVKKFLYPFIQFPHKCMYDSRALLEIVNEAGFNAVCKGAFDSDIDDIRQVEQQGRTENAVIIEGRKRSNVTHAGDL